MRPRRSAPNAGGLADRGAAAERSYMRRNFALALVLGALAPFAPAGAQAAYSERSVGSPQQLAWVRSAAQRFVAAELAASGAQACAVLIAPLRATVGGRSCQERWSAQLARRLRVRGERARLRSEQRAIGSARVVVRGELASIELPTPLLRGQSRFRFTENCWMLEG
jgi:hypothetical protein